MSQAKDTNLFQGPPAKDETGPEGRDPPDHMQIQVISDNVFNIDDGLLSTQCGEDCFYYAPRTKLAHLNKKAPEKRVPIELRVNGTQRKP